MTDYFWNLRAWSWFVAIIMRIMLSFMRLSTSNLQALQQKKARGSEDD